MKFKQFTPAKFRRRIFSQLWMLALQFVLGMLLNLIDGGTDSTGHAIYTLILAVHILNAIGLVEGGLYIALREQSKLSWWAATVLFATACAGAMTIRTGQDTWSFAMASGFLASSWLCIMLYVRADRSVRASS